MTERGLPAIDGPVACPFVAFADDRDERATSPDHRHRCYAEATPAPRALAHQEAYCLSSAFPVCPTFQDWARREAARAQPATTTSAGMPIPGLTDERPAGDVDDDAEEPVYEDRPRRSGQKNWAAPPPWMNRPDAGAGAGRQPVDDGLSTGAAVVGGADAAAAGSGLAGSFADRLASPLEPPARQRTPVWRDGDRWDDEDDADAGDAGDDDADAGSPGAASAAMAAAAATAARADQAELFDEPSPPRRERDRGQPRDRDDSGRHDVGPSWERPARLETFPSLRERRMAISVPTLSLAAVAVVLAALLLFFLPSLLGIGGGGSTASPTPTVAASAAPVSLEPTLVPEPTQQTYTVQSGDTMSKIAKKFGVPLQTLIDANKTTVPNPDKLKIGDTVVIPVAAPSEIPASSP